MKLQIKLSTNDKNIRIPAIGRNNMLGYDDNVESLVNSNTVQSINNVSDAEVRRFKPQTNFRLKFLFFNGSSFVDDLAPTEFTNSDLGTTALGLSFYLIQLYNSFDGNTQKKYHTGYFNGYDFNKLDANYLFYYDSPTQYNHEFTNIYLPQDLIDSMSGQSTYFYVRFSFYSGKSGKIYSFNNDDLSSTTEEKLYKKILINPTTFTYTFSPIFTPMSFKEITNAAYNTLINNTANSVNVEKPVYPNGNTFTTDGTYTTV